MEQIGAAALPVLVGLLLLAGFVRGVPVFDTFLVGAREGIRTSLQLLPTLLGLIVAVTMVRASGLLELVCGLLAPLAQGVGISPEILPLALLRPLSGSGASAYTLDLFQQYGPDSELGKSPRCWQPPRKPPLRHCRVFWGVRVQKIVLHGSCRFAGGWNSSGAVCSLRPAAGRLIPRSFCFSFPGAGKVFCPSSFPLVVGVY